MSKFNIFLGAALVWSISCLCFTQCQDKQAAQPAMETPAAVPDNHFCATIAPIQRPAQAVGVRSKFWKNGQEIKVKFLNGSVAKKQYILDALAVWSSVVNLKFTVVTTGKSDWRIGFNPSDGSWSYIGLDCSTIPNAQATMNIGWDGLDVCLHEIGHALGMAHEQANPNGGIPWNKPVVYAALAKPPNNWSAAMVEANVFFKYDTATVYTTPFDGISIMQYSIPDSWVLTGHGFPGGTVLSATDKAFMSGIYPFTANPPTSNITITAKQRDEIVRLTTKAKIYTDSATLYTRSALGM